MSVTGVACGAKNVSPTRKYLIDGTKVDNVAGNFDYYLLDGGLSYAVALKESAKSSTSPLTIESTYNNKPVTGIWRYGFANSKAPTITIPSSITTIDYEAFMGSKITSVTIPASVSQIGESAFYACKSLAKASIQNTTTASETSSACSCNEPTDDDDDDERTFCELKKIPSFCFFNCNELKELVLPQSIEEIEYEAFHGCRKLYSTIAFMNIKTIRSRAFQGCASLKNIYISSSFFEKDENTNEPIGVIEDKAFEECNSSLKFWLVGNSGDVQDWLDLHLDNKWRWKDETTNPAVSSNLYTYEITSSGASYSSDWIYTTVNGKVEITSYIGPTEIEGAAIKFLSFPNELPSGSGNKVEKIAIDALNAVKANLERIYLPKYLKRIEANMFNGDYDKLIVIDDNTKCSADEAVVGNISPRIILNGLTELETIGNSAFLNMDKLANITKLALPYSLKAVGTCAFGSGDTDGKHMKAVTEFIWDYDDTKSALKVIGRDAFFKLGNSDNSKNITSSNSIHKNYKTSADGENYKLTTLVIPRTFEHFGITDADNTAYNVGGSEGNNSSFGIRAFAGCQLLEKVIFKGSKKATVQSGANSDNDTFNLIIPSYSFVMNESLRTIIFEERCGKTILFHTTRACQPAIGWSSGRAKNDFSGDPAIQTIILPNKYTKIRMQKYAMQGNSRGAVYFSGASGTNIDGTNTDISVTSFIGNISQSSTGIGNVKEWYQIGIEDNNGYNLNQSTTQNRYGLSQYMPLYYNVHYEETINKSYASVDVFVGLGTTNSENDLIIKDKCAFVCGATKATLSKYLYDRHDTSFTGTATVPATVDRFDGATCTVNAIGASAFSAAYCDGTSYKNYSNHKNLTAVSVPHTIATIGEYAFMRAYGVTKLSSYNASTGVSNGDYVMPSSLTSIGKQAFAFCNIKQFLNIPNGCRFYENNSNTNYETSVFSNNFSLRKITFGNNSTSSTYYTTTTYTHSNPSDTYTSALYSTSSVSKSKNSLLLVLNRDNADRTAPSGDVTIAQTRIGEDTFDFVEFNGRYNSISGYLYGAFKMCYWIDSLVVGTANPAANGQDQNQPLISGVYDVNNNKDSLLYLNTGYTFTGNTCQLKAISFGDAAEISTPAYSFEGCEQLTKIKLPQIPNGSIPAGLFAYITNEDIIFEVPSNAAGTTFKECAKGELDLTYTGYKEIKAEAFKGTNLTKVIAPIIDTFTIEEDAFANCEHLTSFSFENVTTRVVLNKSFRGATIPNNLFNFGSSALIEFGEEAFKGCSFPSKTFVFPTKTAIIGTSCFEACNVSGKELENVSAATDLSYLEPVETDSGEGMNNSGNTTGFKQIGDYAFYKCTNLKNFDFTNFSQIERIGHYAFGMAAESNGVIQAEDKNSNSNNACICTNGIVDLPASITNLGVGAFHSSRITKIIINSTSMKFERGKDYATSTRASYNCGGHTFRSCSALTSVFFTEPDCTWNTLYLLKKQKNIHGVVTDAYDQCNFFSNCASLTSIVLPTDYDLQYEKYTGTTNDKRPDSMVWDSNTSLRFYVYHTTANPAHWNPSGLAISDFWHRMSNGSTAPIVFYVGTNADLIKGTSGSYAEVRPGSYYWTFGANNEIIYLGTATVNASTGVVTFSVNSYTADSSGVHLS